MFLERLNNLTNMKRWFTFAAMFIVKVQGLMTSTIKGLERTKPNKRGKTKRARGLPTRSQKAIMNNYTNYLLYVTALYNK